MASLMPSQSHAFLRAPGFRVKKIPASKSFLRNLMAASISPICSISPNSSCKTKIACSVLFVDRTGEVAIGVGAKND